MAVLVEKDICQEFTGFNVGYSYNTTNQTGFGGKSSDSNKMKVLTGFEIQIYCPDTLLGSPDHGQKLSDVVKALKEFLKVTKSQLKEVPLLELHPYNTEQVLSPPPISYYPPQDGSSFVIAAANSATKSTKTPPKRVRAQRAGYLPISFQLSEMHVKLLEDMEKSNERATEEVAHRQKMPLIPLRQRLENWTFERRQRIDGRFDLYYHHKQSKATFRSTVEVIDFILHNSYPTKPITGNKRKPDQNQHHHHHKDQGSATKRDQTKAVCPNQAPAVDSIKKRKLERTRIIVENFLRDSYMNLQNSGRKYESHSSETDNKGTDPDHEEMLEKTKTENNTDLNGSEQVPPKGADDRYEVEGMDSAANGENEELFPAPGANQVSDYPFEAFTVEMMMEENVVVPIMDAVAAEKVQDPVKAAADASAPVVVEDNAAPGANQVSDHPVEAFTVEMMMEENAVVPIMDAIVAEKVQDPVQAAAPVVVDDNAAPAIPETPVPACPRAIDDAAAMDDTFGQLGDIKCCDPNVEVAADVLRNQFSSDDNFGGDLFFNNF